MIVITSTYTRSLEDQDLVKEHLEFVQRYVDDGVFVAAGPRLGATGGVVVTRGLSEDELRSLMRRDPFVRAGLVADYEYLPFRATMSSLSDLVES